MNQLKLWSLIGVGIILLTPKLRHRLKREGGELLNTMFGV